MSVRHRGIRRLRLVLAALLLPVAALTGATAAHAADTVEVDGVTYELAVEGNPGAGAVAVSYSEATNPAHPDVALQDEVTIGGNSAPVVEIAQAAFRDTDIASATLPAGLTTIGPYAFGMNDLTEIDLPESVTRIEGYAFISNNLTSVDLPELVFLGQHAFRRNALTSVTLPETLTTLWDKTFSHNNLQTLTIPASITSLGAGVFGDNPDLENVLFLGAEPSTGDSPFASEQSETSPQIEHLWREGEGQAASGGFTWPTWHELATSPYVEIQFSDPTAGTPMPAPLFLPLSELTEGTLWTTVPESLLPSPAHSDLEFTGWTIEDAGTQDDAQAWSAGDPIYGDATLTAVWEQPAPELAAIVVHASATEVDEGDSVTLTAEGFDADGLSLGDVTAETTFTSDVATDVVDGDQVTFPTASAHTITGTHETQLTDAVVIEVIPTAVEPEPTQTTDPTPTPEPTQSPESTETTGTTGDTLAATGATSQPLAAAAGLTMLGALLLVLARRRVTTMTETGR
ncbi:leucine-rich repeat protein [Ruania alkalisoli]|uniref:Leucine-rich repeat protein n=1 Tax=Ruania alkalisoli TaxID=2779775 RepID=A0A7M1SXB0_9MICO|nr:leucine-rich repeat protein [Ruania alkalisoli]QOR71584.1 leucine-rich repeat protein [Ruania alkalisoli]